MKSLTLILILSCLTFALAEHVKKDIKEVVKAATGEKGPLHYYHIYEENHGTFINPKIPVKQHYENERKERKELFHLKDALRKLKETTHFKLLDLERRILAFENNDDVLKNTVNGNDRINEQKAMSLKEEINHDEKFKELYADRLDLNTKKEKTASPDQVPVYEKLVKFDSQRDSHWAGKEKENQKKLDSQKRHTVEENEEDRRNMGVQQSKVVRLSAEEKSVLRQEKYKVKELKDEEKDKEARLNAMTALDAHRQQESKVENKETIKA